MNWFIVNCNTFKTVRSNDSSVLGHFISEKGKAFTLEVNLYTKPWFGLK